MTPPEAARPGSLRLDKWLWAARFFKTRALASEAVSGGKVKLNGHAVKPAREVRVGDRIELTLGDAAWDVRVAGLNEYRRPAAEAQQLYQESDESRARRQAASEARKLAPPPGSELKGRPTKRDRRQMQRFAD